jgi:hypothetical protein
MNDYAAGSYARHTNGRVRVEQRIAETRELLERRPRRLRRVLLPALLALGVLLVWRQLEQDTAGS